jgi:hypothetical protein
MQWATKIKKHLQDGLYVNTLQLIGDEAWEAVKVGQSTFPAYVIQQISRDILACWDDVPLAVAEANRVEDALRPLMEAVLDAILSNASQAHIVASVEALIKKRVDTLSP